jgi:hypothetical protein
MNTESTFWFGDTILRLDKILAVQHNTNSENNLKPSNYVFVTLDTSDGTTIEVEFKDFEHASDSIQNLKQEWENYLYEQRKSK